MLRSYTVKAHKDGAYHWAGKQFLSDLSAATQYQARVSAENAEVRIMVTVNMAVMSIMIMIAGVE